MPPARLLATFVHLSDLHIGLPLSRAGAGLLDARVERYIRWHRHFDGLLGHHFDALEDIEDFLLLLRKAGETFRLVVTGDLTRNGDPAQFAAASVFLGNRLPPKYGGVGLAQADWMSRAIPGNHDHWPGNNRPLGGPTAALDLFFGHLPARTTLRLPDGTDLEFIAVDSDADVAPVSLDRLRARGRFTSQLAALRQRAAGAAPRPGVVRVLLLHHSIRHRDPGRWGLLEIDSGSRAPLDEFLVRERVSVVLTGHVHQPYLPTLPITWDGTTRRILEACCGTSATRDAHPGHWNLPPGRRLEPNTLLLHRVYAEAGGLRWRTWVRTRLAGTGFGTPPDADAEPPVADHQLT